MTSDQSAVENNSGQGKAVALPPGLKGWNWGAFLWTWIWGLGNRTYIALLGLVPFVNVIMMFVLGAKGNEWAWQNKRWESIDHFRRTQRNWGIAGLVYIVLVIVLVVVVSMSGSA